MAFWQLQGSGTSSAPRPGGSQDAPRLLLIEDDPAFAASLQRLLGHAGYQTTVAASGQDGLQALQAEPPDLMLVDLMLPDLSGHDVIRAAREQGLDVPAIVVSGESEIDAAILALRLGALDYVRKPLEPEILLHAVARALAQGQLEREYREAQRQLERSEALHRFLVDTSPDLIFILDEAGRVSYVNQRLDELLGVPQAQAVGQPFARLVHELDYKRAADAFSPSGLALTARHGIELRLRRGPDGDGFRPFDISLAAVGLPSEAAAPAASDPGVCYHGVARDLTAHREAEEQTRYQAHHDPLTGLPNRSLFREHLGLALIQARRKQGRLAVLFLNLDRFKHVNDLIGHVKADEVLRDAGERIQGCLTTGDTLARFVGDEFLLLTPVVQHEQALVDLLERINQALAQPLRAAGRNLRLSVSAGIALYPEHGRSADALIRHANIALYHGRLAGGHTTSFFIQAMVESADQRLRLQSELRQAIEQDQLELYYQPQVDIRSGQVKGVEALVRWNHPELGLLPPGEFLPLAEEADLMRELGEWVICSACQTLRAWDAQGLALPRVAVNISPQHLDDSDFVTRFFSLLQMHGVEPARIEVELTENLFIRDPDDVARKLQGLAARGVMIAIDDFGTQYSSLGYLQRFPIHTLKIDKSFVWEIDREYRQHAIIKAIISIAHGLGLNLIAEGVETDEQLQFLLSQGCDEIQGYLISKPLKRQSLEALLARGLPLQPSR